MDRRAVIGIICVVIYSITELVMARAIRAEQFQAAEISIVHAVQRCVRRAFLAGVDAVTGKDFSYRKEWIRRRMEALLIVG